DRLANDAFAQLSHFRGLEGKFLEALIRNQVVQGGVFVALVIVNLTGDLAHQLRNGRADFDGGRIKMRGCANLVGGYHVLEFQFGHVLQGRVDVFFNQAGESAPGDLLYGEGNLRVEQLGCLAVHGFLGHRYQSSLRVGRVKANVKVKQCTCAHWRWAGQNGAGRLRYRQPAFPATRRYTGAPPRQPSVTTP